MEQVPLTPPELKTIRFARNQVLISFIAIALIVTVMTGVFSVILYKTISLGSKAYLLTGLIGLIIATFLFFVYKGIQAHVKDLKQGTKAVIRIKVDEKNTYTNHGWHGNLALDMRTQPKLTEYFLLAGEHKYFVEEEIYRELKEGDIVEIHVTNYSGIILAVKKVSP